MAMTRFSTNLFFRVTELCAIASLSLAGSASFAADQAIPLQINLLGTEAASDITISTPQSTDSLTPNSTRLVWTGTLTKERAKEKFVDVNLVYGTASYPLRLRVLPSTIRVQFDVVFNQPESCSRPFVDAVDKVAVTKTEAMKLALTAGFMLARPGPTDNCKTHETRLKKARYDRYVNLMQRSFEFVVPPQITDDFIASATDKAKATRLAANYDTLERQRSVEALQAGVLLAQERGAYDVALANSEIIEASAKADTASADIVYSKIDRSAVENQVEAFRTIAADRELMAEPN
jgi:hypothetical protein